MSSTDKSGNISGFTYDVFDNVLSVTKGEDSITYTYDLLGKRTSMTDSTGTTSYTYSPYGELTKEEKDSIIKTYTTDALGRRTSMSVQNGEDVLTSQTYTYDSIGRLVSTFNGTDTAEYTYDANSNVLTETVNGTLIKSTNYNQANLPCEIVTHLPNIAETEYRTYSADGNLRILSEQGKDTFYYYDGANRLTYEGVFGNDISYEDFYTYDRFGNRANKEHTDLASGETQSIDYEYNVLNQLTEQTHGTDTLTYTYDDNGNMLEVKKNNEVIKTYTYDPFNRLATANVNGNTAQYTYNGDNLRQTKTVNGVTTHHVYDGQNIVADIGTDTNTYIYGVNLIGMHTNNSTLQIYATTPRGDVAKLINPDGTYQEYEYDAYGNTTGDNTYTVNPFGYTGQYTDYETGLVYLRNRYYDTELGVFLTEDPIKDGSNWYAYCSGNPVMFVDLLGMKMQPRNAKIADFLVNQIIKATGDSGYSYDENSGFIVYEEGHQIEGGSEVARNLINYFVTNDDNYVRVNFKSKIIGGIEVNDALSGGYTNGDINIGSVVDDDNVTSTFIHELTHAYTKQSGLDDSILYSFTDPNDSLKNDIIEYVQRQYKEATAITVEEQFRQEMGYDARNTVTNHIIGTNNYAQFPHILTSDPNQTLWGEDVNLSDRVFATTLISHSTLIVEHINNWR